MGIWGWLVGESWASALVSSCHKRKSPLQAGGPVDLQACPGIAIAHSWEKGFAHSVPLLLDSVCPVMDPTVGRFQCSRLYKGGV